MGGDGNGYQLHLPCVGLFPQVLPEIEMIHPLVDEGKGVFLGRIHPQERYYACTLAVKEVA